MRACSCTTISQRQPAMGLSSSRLPPDSHPGYPVVGHSAAASAAASSTAGLVVVGGSVSSASSSTAARRPLPPRPRVHSHLQASTSSAAGSSSNTTSAAAAAAAAVAEFYADERNRTSRNRSRSLDFLAPSMMHPASSSSSAAARGGASVSVIGEADDNEEDEDELDDEVDEAAEDGQPRERRPHHRRHRLPPPPPPRHSRAHHALMLRHLGLPASFYRADIRCPVCGKTIPHDDTEIHLVMCLTKPRIVYNEDVLAEDRDAECAICLDDLSQGDTIARLPCLCIYHKGCIDDWFKRSRTCPQHPDDA